MEATFGGNNYYADVNFDKWPGATIENIQIPDLINNYNLLNQFDVTNLSVNSNYPGVINGQSFLGRVEIWAQDYAPFLSGSFNLDLSQGNNSNYDFDDRAWGSGSYGSFQVHNITSQQTVLAWNQHSSPNSDIGFGNNPGGNPDWTFSNNSGQFSNWKIQIFVN